MVGLIPHPEGYEAELTLFLSHFSVWITFVVLMAGNRDTADIKRMLIEQIKADPRIPDEVARCEE